MAQFSVKKNNVNSVINTEVRLADELNSIASELRSVSGSLSFKLVTSANIRSRLNSAADNVTTYRTAMHHMRSALQDTINAYENTEEAILAGKSGKTSKVSGVSTLGYVSGGNKEIKVKKAKSNNLINILHSSDLSDDNPFKKAADKLYDFNNDRKKTIIKGFWTKGGIFNNVIDKDKNSDQYTEFKEVSSFKQNAKIASLFAASKSGNFWGLGSGGSVGVASGAYSVSALKGKVDGEAYAGLYSYDKDGNKKFTPGIGARVGASASAFSAEAQGAIGDEYFNVHGSTSVEALSANAKASANVGLYDKDGKLNPQLSASASAEAILAEASVTGGTTVAGTDINVSGGVNFGVGAHADFGIQNGKVSVDIGASLGVGVSVKFDVDFSGTVNAVSDKISSGWSKFCGWVKGK